MVAVMPAVALLLVQAADAAPGTTDATPAKVAPPAPAAADACPGPASDSTTIVICTQRPQGYRLNPDVMEAKREMHSGGRPVRPGGTPRPDCASVGPAPCLNAGINLIGAALTAAEMAERLAKGQEIGTMFVTDPHPSEYQLYLMAKARREADEAEKAAKAKAAAAAAAQARPQPDGN